MQLPPSPHGKTIFKFLASVKSPSLIISTNALAALSYAQPEANGRQEGKERNATSAFQGRKIEEKDGPAAAARRGGSPGLRPQGPQAIATWGLWEAT